MKAKHLQPRHGERAGSPAGNRPSWLLRSAPGASWALILLAAVLSLGAKGCQGPPPAACDACRANPTAPGCAVVLATCTAPPTTTTTTSSTTTTTTLPHPPPPPQPPVPPAAGCKAPAGVAWRGPGPTLTDHRSAVVKVLRELAGCQEGTDCPLPGDSQQSWQARVIAELRFRGLCAGQHVIGETDQIAVAVDGCGGPWAGYYVFACAPARPGEVDGLGNPLDICPLVGRGKVRWAVPAPSWTPVSGCTTSPPPSGPPTCPAGEVPVQPPGATQWTCAATVPPGPVDPPPVPGACSKSAADVNRWEIEAKWHGGSVIDTTPVAVGDAPPCDHPDERLARKCYLSGEKGNQGCADKLWGKTLFGGTGITFIAPWDPGGGPNDNMAKITGGEGTLSICGSLAQGEGRCRDVHVIGGIPPCDVFSNDDRRCK